VTVTAFALGATAAAAATGALLGAVGGALLPADLGPDARLALVMAALAGALVLDAVPLVVPGPRRQVNERWLDRYRGWVYGLGYGAQLGVGVTTVVSSAATYATFAAAVLAGRPASGAIVLGCFGVIRGLTPLTAAHVRTPGQLMAVHRRLAGWRAPVQRLSTALLAALCLLALAGAVG
jgi:hypothetical protein